MDLAQGPSSSDQVETNDQAGDLAEAVAEESGTVPAKRQKAGGRPRHPIWNLFEQTAEKHNTSHHRAICKACKAKGKRLLTLAETNGRMTFVQCRL